MIAFWRLMNLFWKHTNEFWNHMTAFQSLANTFWDHMNAFPIHMAISVYHRIMWYVSHKAAMVFHMFTMKKLAMYKILLLIIWHIDTSFFKEKFYFHSGKCIFSKHHFQEREDFVVYIMYSLFQYHITDHTFLTWMFFSPFWRTIINSMKKKQKWNKNLKMPSFRQYLTVQIVLTESERKTSLITIHFPLIAKNNRKEGLKLSKVKSGRLPLKFSSGKI